MEGYAYYGRRDEVDQALALLGPEVVQAYRRALEAIGGQGGKVLANLFHTREGSFLQVVWMEGEEAASRMEALG